MSTLTREKIQEMADLLIGNGLSSKKQIFDKFFPGISDYDGYELIVPVTTDKQMLKFVNENKWVHMDANATNVFAVDMKEIMKVPNLGRLNLKD